MMSISDLESSLNDFEEYSTQFYCDMMYIDGKYSEYCQNEYDRWSQTESSSNLESKIKAPCSDVISIDHMANQTTYTEGSEMYANSISASALHTPLMAFNSRLLPNICKKYLGESLKTALLSAESLLVKSPQGTGKTSAVKALLRDDYKVLMMSPRDKLNQALANELPSFHYYVDIKKAIDKKQSPDLIIPMIERMTCTPQSLPAIAAYYEKHTGEQLSYNILVLDEIEAIAEMLTSNVTRNKINVLKVFKDVANRSRLRVGLDAFPTEKSQYLMGFLSPSGLFSILENTYKRWSGIDVMIIEGGNYSRRSEALAVLQDKALREGKRIAITSSGAGYCARTYANIKKLHPDLKIILIDRDGSPEATELMNDTSLISNYDVIIYTPTINVGVSFDIQNHVDYVFASFPNTEGTGGTSDALQALARVRHLVGNKWFIVLDDYKELFSGDREKLMPGDVYDLMLRQIKQECWSAGKSCGLSELEHDLLKLWIINDGYRVSDKNNFNDVFEHNLKYMGVSINRMDLSDIGANSELQEVSEITKEEIKAVEIKAKTQSERIDEKQYNHIAMRMKHDKSSVTSCEHDSVKRFKFESKFNINCDELSAAALDEYLELDDSNAIGKVINREIAEGATAEFNKRLMKARVVGLGDNGAFKVDIIDDKMNYRLKAQLLSYAVPYFNGESYTHKDLVRSSFAQFIDRHANEILVSKVVPLPSGWKKKPALLMNHLIESCGFKITMSREVDLNNKRKVKVQRWRGVSIKAIDDLVVDRMTRGESWIQKTTTLMDMYIDMGAYLKPEHIEMLQMPRIDINFVHEQLKLIPSYLKDDLLSEYREKYDMMNPDNDGFNAPKNANEWLLFQVLELGYKNTVLTA